MGNIGLASSSFGIPCSNTALILSLLQACAQTQNIPHGIFPPYLKVCAAPHRLIMLRSTPLALTSAVAVFWVFL